LWSKSAITIVILLGQDCNGQISFADEETGSFLGPPHAAIHPCASDGNAIPTAQARRAAGVAFHRSQNMHPRIKNEFKMQLPNPQTLKKATVYANMRHAGLVLMKRQAESTNGFQMPSFSTLGPVELPKKAIVTACVEKY
jgi:hypothetical protein